LEAFATKGNKAFTVVSIDKDGKVDYSLEEQASKQKQNAITSTKTDESAGA
jgi:hypothetical protein